MASEHQQFAPPVEGVGRRQEMGERVACNSLWRRGCRWSAAGWPGSPVTQSWTQRSTLHPSWGTGSQRWLKKPKGNSCIRAEDGRAAGKRERYILFTPNQLPCLISCFSAQMFTTSILSKMVFLVTKVNFMLFKHILSIFLLNERIKNLFSVLNICPFSLKSLLGKIHQNGLSWY